jgi:hypothetical protein
MGQLTGYYVDDRLDSNYEIIVRENILDNMVNRKKGKILFPLVTHRPMKIQFPVFAELAPPFFLT